MISLTVTPLRRLTGRNELIRLRRMLGLLAFFYACLHFSTWLVLDWFFDFASMAADVVERPFITMGMATFLLLIPLAVTSTAGMIRRLGKRWQQLHRLVYVAGAHRRHSFLVGGQGGLQGAAALRARAERPARLPRMVDAADAPVVAILTRAPSSGGKTRLFTSLGVPADPALLTALLLDTLDGAAAPGVRRVVAVTPPEACDDVRRIAGGVEVMPQPARRPRRSDARRHGARCSRAARRLSPLIGSDLPHITPATIAEAFSTRVAAIRDALVLGPAADGGYYLIAAGRRARRLLQASSGEVPRVLRADRSGGG